MDIGKAFSYVFDDEQWVSKILIGGLIMIIPIIGQIALYGYVVEAARNVAQGNPRPLPGWNNFGDKLIKGLYVFVISLVYLIPVIILQILVAIISSMSEDTGAFLSLCLSPLILVASIALSIATYAAIVRYIQTDNLSDAFQFAEVFAMVKGSLSTWLILFLVSILSGLVAAVGIIACGIGLLFTAVYGSAVFAHALGQTAIRVRGAGVSGV